LPWRTAKSSFLCLRSSAARKAASTVFGRGRVEPRFASFRAITIDALHPKARVAAKQSHGERFEKNSAFDRLPGDNFRQMYAAKVCSRQQAK
jgi:hypothetical protein